MVSSIDVFISGFEKFLQLEQKWIKTEGLFNYNLLYENHIYKTFKFPHFVNIFKNVLCFILQHKFYLFYYSLIILYMELHEFYW